MQGRTYTIVFSGALTAQADLFEITPADDKPIEICAVHIGQTSDAGDAQDEMIGFDIIRGHTTSGSGGSSATPTPISPADAAAGFTAEVGNTTIASAGTTTTLHSDAFNVRAGYTYVPPMDCRPAASQANTTLVGRLSAPADSLSYKITVYVRELA